MLDYDLLRQVVPTLSTIDIQGIAFRQIKLKYLLRKFDNNIVFDTEKLLSAIGSRKGGGRYNPPLISDKESKLTVVDLSEIIDR
jgi:hypothetical protein